MTLISRFVGLALALAPIAATASDPDPGKVRRGEYLATIGLCNDCHTPLRMTSDGPVPDMSRMLSGHPETLAVTATTTPKPWMAMIAPTLTAFVGPWGTSFAANLTPDPQTGVLRDFTEAQFIATTGATRGRAARSFRRCPGSGSAR